ncbi:MAG: NAD-dependent deacylase [Caldilineaceae bacterium]|nr:NAD-dependent deacylase [Caldilineaceae bacterium]
MADVPLLTQASVALAQAKRIVCLTGAGISAESGVATFRAAQSGLWARFDPQRLASQAGFAADPGLVWRWYMARLASVEAAVPNPGHLALVALERVAPAFTLVTQNVDDLHERAGSRQLWHVHGQISQFHCNRCHAPHALQPDERTHAEPPICRSCGGHIRPGVVWFGEGLPSVALDAAWRAAEACEVMLVVGTSGVVYPVAELPQVAQAAGAVVIDVNPQHNPIAARADFFLQGAAEVVLPQVIEQMRAQGQ